MKFTQEMAEAQNARFDEAGRRRAANMKAFVEIDTSKPKPKKRLRQSEKPLLNKLEQEWLDQLKQQLDISNIHCQAQRFELARGLWYKPDFTCFGSVWINTGSETTRACKPMAYEVKGPHAFRGGFENLKMAARTFPEIVWKLVWKENGQWQEQTVLP